MQINLGHNYGSSTKNTYTSKVEDAAEAEEIFVIKLMGDEADKRREFIQENAALVEELDV